MELRLLNSLTNKEIYTECVNLISPDIFSDELEDIMVAMQELHSKFDENIDMECGDSDEYKMWITGEGDTIWE